MSYKRTTLVSIMVAGVCIAVALAGCGQRDKAELNLPETETKQLETVEAGPAAKPAEPAAAKAAVSPTGEFKKFYVYADQGYFKNHFIPSGWMGDYGDIKFNDASQDKPYSRKTCIKITYTAQRKQGAGWAGIYWQEPANNWGNLKGGYDLTGAKKVTFWARGEKGGEVVTEFKIGGINGEHSDSASGSVGPIKLTPEWKQYEIDLKDEDLSLVIGGFAFVISSVENPEGATFYLDDIAFE